MDLLHQDAKHGTIECGRCIRWRSILVVLQLWRRRGKASASSSLWWSPAALRWMDVNGVTILGCLGGCIYALGVPWGVLHLALHEILLGREALVSIKSASSRFSWFTALPCRHHISHVRTPNNANSVSRLCATKLSSTLVLISFLETKIRFTKQPRKIMCLISDLSTLLAFWGSYLLAPWPELGLPYIQIEAIVKAHNFSTQTFAIKGRLTLRICTKRSCYSGLREYLSGWVDLVGKPSSPQSFTC
jgi:hypothetical protein